MECVNNFNGESNNSVPLKWTGDLLAPTSFIYDIGGLSATNFLSERQTFRVGVLNIEML